MHVHVKSSDGIAKFILTSDGVLLETNNGMSQKDIRCAEMVLEENRELAMEKWNEYFGSSL